MGFTPTSQLSLTNSYAQTALSTARVRCARGLGGVVLKNNMTLLPRSFARAGFAACAGLMCSALLLTGCQEKKAVQVQRPPIPVTYVTATIADENIWVEALGETEGVKQAEVRAQVSGILEKIAYKEGDCVKEGDTLFLIDQDTYRAAYNAAVAERKQVEAQLVQERREAERYKRLYESKATSKKTWDDAQSAVDIRVANLRMARANEESARINLERTAVKATSDGIVSRSLVNTGTLVSATDTLLATITQPEEMRIVFAVSERDLDGATITLENKVRLRLDNGKTVDAKLDYVARQIDPTSASLMMRAKVPAGTPGVVPGQFVHVQLQTHVEKHAIRVPQRSVIQKPDGTYQVYVIRGDVARAVPVTVGLWKDTDWIILSGLEAGDKVVTDQIQRMRDKQPVTLVEKK